MRNEDRVRIQHMIDAAETAAQFIAGKRRDELDSDRMLQFAVLRAIEILGEAAAGLAQETRIAADDVPWSAIISM